MTNIEAKEKQLHPDIGAGRTYFAASNSAEGFVSYYRDCFGPGTGVDRLYIIKSGPGTGKSHFMYQVARYATARGWEAVYYRCSSDPGSLDGLRLTRRDGACGCYTIGLLDGTAPHAWEPSLPGTWEDLVDLGQFWDSAVLDGQRPCIRALGSTKSDAYGRAYHYLRGCGEADHVLEELTAPLTDSTRLNSLAGRILRESAPDGESAAGTSSGVLFPGGFLPGGTPIVPALRRAVGMTGRVCLDSFTMEAERVLYVGDRLGTGTRLLELLLTQSRHRGWPVMVSHDPIRGDRPDGLFWPERRLCVLNDTAPPQDTISDRVRTLSLRRYVDSSGLKVKKKSIREAILQRDTLLDSACCALSEASEAHFALEAIYTAAMDFPAKEAFTQAFCRKVFGE